jgi:hypothetical protein
MIQGIVIWQYASTPVWTIILTRTGLKKVRSTGVRQSSNYRKLPNRVNVTKKPKAEDLRKYLFDKVIVKKVADMRIYPKVEKKKNDGRDKK